ncbi:NAD(P)/FAD-dependent oxidoreductase [Streptomyces tsukubensis]|uniref:Pyridine nucleotide-disulfide oxidoreductase n=2 Tax=Streptomyces TaxID=1883 RepID=A0A7G3U9I3_STRT9|nr:FAD-dependent oxidoreductase [Streptomyces tsukubensis]AZK98043.1 pyridine nucleotide-disulfide oxidoreductase [Streptomyces tsukubensis]QKM66035.1 pyridine nucleotide-disulfide oxidoreductase [Streptomyces tsukubensis NRRL18488]TAI42315.1 FAD-binding protein [Streptomyces tsukubensis]
MTSPLTPLTPDVLVVGAGPAGLTAAAALARLIPGEVLVLEREAEPGGIPRHSHHTGFGLRDLRRLLTGPAYARRLTDAARDAGAVVRTRATVTGWAPDPSDLPAPSDLSVLSGLSVPSGPSDLAAPAVDGTSHRPAVDVTSPEGRFRVRPRIVVLATGARERPRAARLLPGDRPAGVLTTGQLQNALHLNTRRTVGRRAVVVGTDPVSRSAALALHRAGCRVALLLGPHRHTGTPAALALTASTLLRAPVAHRTRLVRIIGRTRVEAVEIEHLDTGARRTVDCDTVVLTGDWIPDHELARNGGLDLDPGTRGPLVDTALRTSRPGVYAAGNLLHPVGTADAAALDGRHLAALIAARLAAEDPTGPPPGVRLLAEAPFRWVAPGLLRPGDPAPPRGRLLLWTDEYHRAPRLVLRRDGRTIAERRSARPAAPGRILPVPWSFVPPSALHDPGSGPLVIGLR